MNSQIKKKTQNNVYLKFLNTFLVIHFSYYLLDIKLQTRCIIKYSI